MAGKFTRMETKVVHSGEIRPRIEGAVCAPIFQTVNYESSDKDNYLDVPYVRLSNTPNQLSLQEKLAAIEGAQAAVVTASGMAAITTALLAFLSTDCHILAHLKIYGGTYGLLKEDLPSLGITHDFIDGTDPSGWETKLKPQTRAIYVETITNPLMEVCDLSAVVAFARKHNLISIIDNTFATPVNFQPFEHGFDLSIHSCTKYLNGHSDIAAGVCLGSQALIDKVKQKLGHFGCALDPHAAFLLNRGLKTLALRVGFQNASALKIAKFLSGHSAVAKVNYPGLPENEHHERACRWLTGFGGMLSFELKGDLNYARRFLSRLNIPANACSLGGVESLITRPATTSHLGMPAKERAALGVTDTLIRLSVGIEATDDLIEDLDQALKADKCTYPVEKPGRARARS